MNTEGDFVSYAEYILAIGEKKSLKNKRQIAKKIGMSISSFYNLLRGKHKIKVMTLERIIQGIGFSGTEANKLYELAGVTKPIPKLNAQGQGINILHVEKSITELEKFVLSLGKKRKLIT